MLSACNHNYNLSKNVIFNNITYNYLDSIDFKENKLKDDYLLLSNPDNLFITIESYEFNKEDDNYITYVVFRDNYISYLGDTCKIIKKDNYVTIIYDEGTEESNTPCLSGLYKHSDEEYYLIMAYGENDIVNNNYDWLLQSLYDVKY